MSEQDSSKKPRVKKQVPEDQRTVLVDTKNIQILSYLEKKAVSDDLKLIKINGLSEKIVDIDPNNVSKVHDTVKKYLENEENRKECRDKAVKLAAIMSKYDPDILNGAEIEYKDIVKKTNLSYKEVKDLVDVFSINSLAIPVNNHCFQFCFDSMMFLPYLERKLDEAVDNVDTLMLRYKKAVEESSILDDNKKQEELVRIKERLKNNTEEF